MAVSSHHSRLAAPVRECVCVCVLLCARAGDGGMATIGEEADEDELGRRALGSADGAASSRAYQEAEAVEFDSNRGSL